MRTSLAGIKNVPERTTKKGILKNNVGWTVMDGVQLVTLKFVRTVRLPFE
jgi:hypothetical protein